MNYYSVSNLCIMRKKEVILYFIFYFSLHIANNVMPDVINITGIWIHRYPGGGPDVVTYPTIQAMNSAMY